MWKFCGGGPIADELANFVLDGKKTATASAKIAYETEHEPIPEVGCLSVHLHRIMKWRDCLLMSMVIAFWRNLRLFSR